MKLIRKSFRDAVNLFVKPLFGITKDNRREYIELSFKSFLYLVNLLEYFFIYLVLKNAVRKVTIARLDGLCPL